MNENKIPQDIKMGSWFDKYHNIFANLNMEKPSEYDQTLPEFEDVPGHKKYTMFDVYNYFKAIMDGRLDIFSINTIKIINTDDEIQCDYCEDMVRSSVYMKHCTVCKKNLCDVCWDNKGENVKGCIQHNEDGHFKMVETDPETIGVYCDVCNLTCGAGYNHKQGVWHCNRLGNKDLCDDCYNSNKGQKLLDSEDYWTIYNITDTSHFITEFGSIFEWIPVLGSGVGDLVLYNMVPSSYNYRKVALAYSNDYEQLVIYTVDESLNDVLRELRNPVGPYNSSIEQYMSKRFDLFQ